MPELSELFDQAKALVNVNDEAQKEAAIETLRKSWHPLFQAISNIGFGAAQAKFTTDLNAEKNAREAAEAKLRQETERHQQQILDLQNKAPEVATVNQQWETKLSEVREEHRKQQQRLRDQLRGTWVQRDQGDLQNELEKRGVPKANARILAKDPELLPERGDYDETGKLSVRMAGQQISLAPGSGQTFLSLLADEVVGRPEVAEILQSDVDRGSGVSGGSTPGSGDKAFFDSLRQRVKEAPSEGAPLKPLKERVGGR